MTPEKGSNLQCKSADRGSCTVSDNKDRQLPQVLAVAGISVGNILDGTVIAYSSPALPSLLADDSPLKIDHHHASWIGRQMANERKRTLVFAESWLALAWWSARPARRAGHFRCFFNFFNKKNDFFAFFFIKLVTCFCTSPI